MHCSFRSSSLPSCLSKHWCVLGHDYLLYVRICMFLLLPPPPSPLSPPPDDGSRWLEYTHIHTSSIYLLCVGLSQAASWLCSASCVGRGWHRHIQGSDATEWDCHRQSEKAVDTRSTGMFCTRNCCILYIWLYFMVRGALCVLEYSALRVGSRVMLNWAYM